MVAEQSFVNREERERQIRRMIAADADAVQSILQESPEAAQWPVSTALGDGPGDARAWVAENAGKVIGVVVSRAAAGEAELLNLAVLPGWRRRGLGGLLLARALSEMQDAGAESIFLEVRESNLPARSFYTSAGFVMAGRRRAYYRNPVEDALILSRTLQTKWHSAAKNS